MVDVHQYSLITNSVEITVIPIYQKEQSMPLNNYFVWEYNVKIKNHSDKPLQLLSRHWVIVDNNGVMQEVVGDGVIGLQPLIKPGKDFEYTSGVQINSSSGMMMGTYDMLTEDKKTFEVKIPTFSLDSPEIDKILN